MLWFHDNRAEAAVSRVEWQSAVLGHHTGRAFTGPYCQGDCLMETSHVHALQQKHEGLDRRLRDEMNRPSPDSAKIQALKKQKLAIKEEIALH